ncbi:MAG: GDSL-type esterase/lipase family protein [Gemmataceae bacterium]|nr:GDSL-type esterase/lipase family protein [Gemmataceae bacterium]
MKALCLYAAAFVVLTSAGIDDVCAQDAKLDLRPGDRVVLIGDTFAERARLYGYIETLFHCRLPDHKLTFRNLGYSADTVAVHVADITKGNDRDDNRESNRALNFPTMHKLLAETKADVIFMCFGMADSFAGEAGLADFTKNLQSLIKDYGSQKYNGKTTPRLMLIGPIAHEAMGGQFPDPAEHNKSLKLYSEEMRRIAAKNKLPFVDLFSPTLALMNEKGGDKLTINGIHLTEYGYWAVAQFLEDSILGRVRRIVRFDAKAQNKTDVTFRVRSEDIRAFFTSPPPAKVHSSLASNLPLVIIDGLSPGDYSLQIGETNCASASHLQWAKGQLIDYSEIQAAAEGLRRSIVDRDQEFFFRWRAVNGEYIYGRRAKPFGVVNFPGEMKQLDAICQNLDSHIHTLGRLPNISSFKASAKIGTGLMRVTNMRFHAPAIEKVYNQKRGIIGGKEFPTAADPEAARKHFKVQDGFEINLFASEKDFPLHNPVAMAWDTKGRLWVTTMPSYPHYLPGVPPNDKILILEDTDGDGKADKHTVFADGLYLPTGIEFGDGGVYVGAQPDLIFLKDTNGDDKADIKETILHGFGSGDSHHALHAFLWSPEGALLFHEGIFHRSNVETPWGVVRQRDAGIYRFQPKSHKLEVYVSYNFANPWGQVFDKFGFNFIADASGGANYNALPFSGYMPFPGQHPGMKVFTSVVRPTCGCELIASRHFPPESQGNFLVNNNIGFQGTKQHQVIEEGSGFTSKELPPLVQSSDPSYRPVAIKHGPDGAMYIVDWFNPLVGHMQFSIRDPGRDHYHGRIWRITAKDRPLVKMPKIHGESIPKLLDALKEPESLTRYLARAELRERDPMQVVSALEKWIAGLEEKDSNSEHHRLEALWTMHGVDHLYHRLLYSLLQAKSHEIRAAATRQLRYVRDLSATVPDNSRPKLLGDPVDLFQTLSKGRDFFVPSDTRTLREPLREYALANNLTDERITLYHFQRFMKGLNAPSITAKQVEDVHPRVRLEGVVALSFLKSARAADLALNALKHPTDYYIDYALKETMSALESYWRPHLAAGKPFAAGNPAGANYILGTVTTAELVKMPRTEPVLLALLSRDGVASHYRTEALEGLAMLHKSDVLTELLGAVERIDKGGVGHSDHVLNDFAYLLSGRKPAELTKVRPQLEKLAAAGRLPLTRQVAYVALASAEAKLEPIWNKAANSLGSLRDLVDAVPILPEAKLRQEAFPRVKELLFGLPETLKQKLPATKGTVGRYVRIELPGPKRTLTLAEVEVFVGGVNVARQAVAKQSSTAHGGVAQRGIDGKKGPKYGDGGQTHTSEEEANPWWEVDLGRELPIEAVVVWNRTENNLGDRLGGYRLLVLDADRHPVFSKDNNPAPKRSSRFALESNPEQILRLAAINAITSIPGHEEEVFATLSNFFKEGKDRDFVVRALQRIPKSKWPQKELKPLADNLVAQLAKVPAKERTAPAILDALQLGNDLASLLPPAQAKEIRAQLGELGVQVVLVRTRPHLMAFDRTKIYVEAGKPAVIVFENNDIMPHNLVIGEPGSLAAIGLASETFATNPDAIAKEYVPPHKMVLHATRLLQPREVDRLQFVAPKDPGEYVYICTFPGHWRVMNGVLHVVPKLADVPPHELNPPIETVASTRPFVRNWTVEELTPELIHLERGRSFDRGKELLKVASCVQCHKMNGVGGDLGPDLAETAKKIAELKMSKIDLLRELIEPSHKIEDKYRVYTIITGSGAIVSGLIVHEDKKLLRVVAGPEDKPKEVRADDIDEKTPSKVSMMPTGLLVTFQRDEILDLLAFIVAGGNESHPAYQRKD